MSEPTWSRIEAKLSRLTKAELIDLLRDLAELDPGARRYLVARVVATTPAAKAKPFRTLIRRAFDPNAAASGPDLDAAVRALAEFSRTGAGLAETIDLMLFFVETGIVWSRTYGSMYAALADSLIAVYGDAVDALSDMTDSAVRKTMDFRLARIVDEAGNTGWGLQENMMALYYPDDLQEHGIRNDDE